MGESERYQEYRSAGNRKFTLGNPNNAIMALLVMNAIFFLSLLTIRVFYLTNTQTIQEFNQHVLSGVQLPTSWQQWLAKPWTLMTYMFSDSSEHVWRLISNILWMASFAYLLQEQQENDKIVPIYLYGGLMAGVCYLTYASYVSPGIANNLIGANAAVVSIAVAATTYNPGYRFFRHIGQGIPVWVLLVLFVFVDFSSIITMPKAILVAHVAGGLTGLLFIILLKKGIDLSGWMQNVYKWGIQMFTPTEKSDGQKEKNRSFYKHGQRKPFEKKPKMTAQRIDEILEKIHQYGYDSLTFEEKQLLKKAAESDDNV